MPDRLIRDELLTSERFIGLPSNDERIAFIALLLTADWLGNTEAGEMRLWRLWRDLGIDREDVDQVLFELAQPDLIRAYEFEGKRYAHIPRFRQQLRYTKCLHPLSPWTTDAQKQALAKNSHGELQVGTMIALRAHHVLTSRSEVKRSDVKRGEVKRGDVTLSPDASRLAGAAKPARKANGHDRSQHPGFAEFWAEYPRKDDKAGAAKVWASLTVPGELVITALKRHKASDQWLRDGGRYVPHASRWLRGRRWEDEGLTASEQSSIPSDLV